MEQKIYRNIRSLDLIILNCSFRSFSRNIKSSPRRKDIKLYLAPTLGCFFWDERKWVAMTWPVERSAALRNVTASKFDSHFAVASGVVAPVFTGLQQRPRNSGLEEFLLPATSPRTFTYTARCILVLTFPCSPLPATDPLAAAGGNNVRDSCESRESKLQIFCDVRSTRYNAQK